MKNLRHIVGLIPFWSAIFFLLICCICNPLCLASDADNQDRQVVICVNQPIHMLDPAIHRSRTLQKILKNMLDSLTTRDSDMKVVPQLAESWKVLDKTSWEFKLRKGVTFHNNEEFTAEDVKFSLERIFKEGGLEGTTSLRKGLLGSVSDVIIVDRYTVIIKTETPWPILPLMLSFHEIVPKKYMEEVGSEGFQSHPVGTGPFEFVRLENKKRIFMKRFENYYGGSPAIPPVQKAPLKSLVFEYVPSKTAQIRMLKTKKCNIISHVDPNAVPILRTNPQVRVLTNPATRSYFVDINCQKPPFNDPRIRQALNYAVDVDKIVTQILQGEGMSLATIMLPNSFGYHPDLKPYTYDPERSRQLLSDAGFNLDRTLHIRCNEDEVKYANALASFFIKIGLKSKISLAEFRRPSILGKPAPWDIDVGSWGDSSLDAVGIILPKLKTNGRGNYSGYSNPIVDNLITKAEGTFDMDLRRSCYQKIQEIVYKDAPMIFGYAKMEFYGIRKEVNNFSPSGSGMINMHDVFILREGE